MDSRSVGWISMLVFVLAGCTQQPPRPPKTELMKRLEADGAGDLTGPGITLDSIRAWLKTKPAPYNYEIRGICSELEKGGATVEWHASIDATICSAAESIFYPGPPRRDGQTFKGGNQ